MDLINKKFRDRITGKIIVIKDAYQNIAITTANEKIDTKVLLKGEIFEYINETAINHQQQIESNIQDEIDPAKFMGGDPTARYTNLFNKIQTIDESRVPTIVNEPVKIKMSSNLTPTDKSEPINYGRSTIQNQQQESESAIIIETDEDFEMKQLEKKYSVNKKMDVSKHNETFAKYFDADENVSLNTNAPVPHNLESKNKVKEIIENQQQPEKVERINVDRNVRHNQIQNEQEYVERIEVKDPVIDMFEKVKRSYGFNMSIKIKRDIPRLDFIEMMEDSYDISIIEYLADEMLNNILNNPMDIKNQIMEEIKSKIYKSTTSEKVEKVEKVKQTKTKGRSKKIKEENDKGTVS